MQSEMKLKHNEAAAAYVIQPDRGQDGVRLQVEVNIAGTCHVVALHLNDTAKKIEHKCCRKNSKCSDAVPLYFTVLHEHKHCRNRFKQCTDTALFFHSTVHGTAGCCGLIPGPLNGQMLNGKSAPTGLPIPALGSLPAALALAIVIIIPPRARQEARPVPIPPPL